MASVASLARGEFGDQSMDVDPCASSSSSCRSVLDPPSSGGDLEVELEEAICGVAVCCKCGLARPPFLALAEAGVLQGACTPCWCLAEGAKLMQGVPVASADSVVITDFAEQLYKLIRDAHAAAAAAIEQVELSD